VRSIVAVDDSGQVTEPPEYVKDNTERWAMRREYIHRMIRNLSGSELKVFMALSSFAHQPKPGEDEESCFAGQAKIAHRAGVSARQVRRALKTLEDAGWIHRRRRGMGRSNYYWFSIPSARSFFERFIFWDEAKVASKCGG